MKPMDDLELNAYIDGELSGAECTELLEAISQNTELAREACALSYLKQQIQLAYASPPGNKPYQPTSRKTPWWAIAASLLMFATGLFGGWLLNNVHTPATTNSPETRIVFHLTNADQILAGELLDDVAQILHAYQRDGKPLRVEIVSNGDGLSLLRTGLSKHQQRINQLSNLYNNLTFVACKNTIERIQISEGIEINIVPEANVTKSGVSHVVKRQREGWAYIRL